MAMLPSLPLVLMLTSCRHSPTMVIDHAITVTHMQGLQPVITEHAARVGMLNSTTPPPFPEIWHGAPLHLRFYLARISVIPVIAGTSPLRSLDVAWIALWDEPAGDTSLCANGKVKMPADPEPKGPVHHAFMLDARTGQGALYYGAQLACGHLRPAHLETATTRFSVKWVGHGNGFVTYAYPACGSPAGGALVFGAWEFFVDVPIGPACAGTRATTEHMGLPFPGHGYVGQIRATAQDEAALPL
ncbi:MAG TPA: hypothetical protein VNG12_03215 [Acidimicrobiales bacterium]|nr:hypothetical protein [Acidimicrobiales bacterium]